MKNFVKSFTDTVDGSEILYQLRLVVYPIIYIEGFLDPRWLCGISEPSAVWGLWEDKT